RKIGNAIDVLEARVVIVGLQNQQLALGDPVVPAVESLEVLTARVDEEIRRARGSVGSTDVVVGELIGGHSRELACADMRRIERERDIGAAWVDVKAHDLRDREARIVQQNCRQYPAPD